MPRPKGKKHPARLSVSVNQSDLAELSRLAAEHDLSMAWIVRKAITEFIERNRIDSQSELPLPRAKSNDLEERA